MPPKERKVIAIRHSTTTPEECILIKEEGVNHCAVRFSDGIECTAVYNCFTGYYYADDKYGLLNK